MTLKNNITKRISFAEYTSIMNIVPLYLKEDKQILSSFHQIILDEMEKDSYVDSETNSIKYYSNLSKRKRIELQIYNIRKRISALLKRIEVLNKKKLLVK